MTGDRHIAIGSPENCATFIIDHIRLALVRLCYCYVWLIR